MIMDDKLLILDEINHACINLCQKDALELEELFTLSKHTFDPDLMEEIINNICGIIVSCDVAEVVLGISIPEHVAIPLAAELRRRGVHTFRST
jgi:hypothetical protein